MTERIEHALVMDTDGIPGRGGYAVVGLSDGVMSAERVFVAANFGISDYLHDPRNERAFYSFCRVPGGGRFAFIRRFPSGKRRNDTQNRLFVHTLFLSDEQFEALQGLPWLLIESKFRTAPGEPWQPLTTDGDRLATPEFPALEWEGEAEIVSGITSSLNLRADRVGKLLGGVDRVQAIANVLAPMRRGECALLPQGTAYELLTLLAWSSLPLDDRAEFAWTQHDSLNVGVAFEVANVAAGATFDAARAVDPIVRRLVETNLASDERRRDFHDLAVHYGIRIRGDRLRLWLDWCDRLSAVREKLDEPEATILGALEALAKSSDASAGEPWAEGQSVLQLLWPNIQRAIEAGQPPEIPVKRWASLLERSGLGIRIFRETPSPEWLGRIAADVGAQLLVFFIVFSTENDADAKPARKALAQWLVDHRRDKPDSFILSRLVVRLGADGSSLTESLLEWLLEAPDGLTVLAEATPLKPAYADLVVLASVVAIRAKHEQADDYVRSALVPHLEKATAETRGHVTEKFSDAVAPILRGDPDLFLRFYDLQPADRRKRLLAKVSGWMTSDRKATLPLARKIVERMALGTFSRSREADALVFALAGAGDDSSRWVEPLLLLANSADARWFQDALGKLDASRVKLQPLYDAVVRQLHPGSGPAMRALLLLTQPAWPAGLMTKLTTLLGGMKDVRAWELIVVAAVNKFGRKGAAEAGKLLEAFWSRIEHQQIQTLSDALLGVTQSTHGPWHGALREQWMPRLRKLPECPQTARLVAIINDTREVRTELLWRAFDLRNATLEMLKVFHNDLEHSDAYERQMGKAVDRWARMMPAREANPLERAQRMLELAGNAGVPLAIRELAANRFEAALEPLRPRDWAALVKLPVAQLMREGSSWMTFTRLLGASENAQEAAADLETICIREKVKDGRDGIRAGRHDTTGLVRRTLKRARAVLRQG